MNKEHTVSGLILFFMGCFIVYTGRFSFGPGMAVELGMEKYVIGLICFAVAFLIIRKA